ncbi:hypothetical protein ES702_01649 [subsurface metagenome]
MLKVGDEVIFKTGKGPIMLVTKENYPKSGSVLCKWWDEKIRNYTTRNFKEEELELHAEKEEEED